jgi:hypothetical protein
MLAEVSTTLAVPIVVTEQYPKAFGSTVSEISAVWAAAAKGKEEESPSSASAQIFKPKFTFSMIGVDADDGDDAASGCTKATAQHVASLGAAGRSNAILCGVEAHVCIQQTCLDLISQGFKVHVISDAVSSQRETDRATAIACMRQAGAVITSSESLVFQLLGGSKHAAFKSVSAIMSPYREAGTLGHSALP